MCKKYPPVCHRCSIIVNYTLQMFLLTCQQYSMLYCETCPKNVWVSISKCQEFVSQTPDVPFNTPASTLWLLWWCAHHLYCTVSLLHSSSFWYRDSCRWTMVPAFFPTYSGSGVAWIGSSSRLLLQQLSLELAVLLLLPSRRCLNFNLLQQFKILQ
jgi:hypothetical protein